MELKKKSWNDITINDYFEIQETMKDETLEPADKEVRLIALLCGVDTDDIWSLQITEFKKLQNGTLWLATPTLKPIEKVKYKNIDINGMKCKVDTDLTKFTVAQYIDFQALFAKKDEKNGLASLLTCFIIPQGKEYNTGYDISELRDEIMSYLDIQTAYQIFGFFLVRWLDSTHRSLSFLKQMIKKNKKKMTQEEFSQRTKEVENLEKTISDGFKLLIGYQI